MKRKNIRRMLEKNADSSLVKFPREDIPVAAEIIHSMSKANMSAAEATTLLNGISEIVQYISHLS